MDLLITDLHKEAAGNDDVVALGGGLPAAEMLPRQAIAAALLIVHAAPDCAALQYGWAEGDPAVRAWIAGRLVARGAAITADDIIITAGAQQALSLAAASLLEAGTAVDVGDCTYPGALDALTMAGGVPTADRRGAGCHYVIPAVSNPTGVDCLADVRHHVLGSGMPVIADEAYAELRFDGRSQRPLIADARDRVWHVGTVSKTLSPGLRVGWLIPPPAERQRVLERKHASDLQAGSLAQAALAALLLRLDYDAHLERARKHYAARAEVLLDALARLAPSSWRVTRPDGGFSVWVETDDELDDVALLEHAIHHGVSFDPGRLFRPADADGPLAFRLSFSSAAPGAISRGVRRLVAAAASMRPRLAERYGSATTAV